MFLPIEDYHQELEAISLALDIGPGATLLAASKGNAQLLGLDRLGEVAAGQIADLVVISAGDPTRDLAALRNVSHTIAAGRVVDWAAIDAAHGPSWFERRDGAS
jgi:imidazolonepropionase-like amidohydrolase